jgi:hypothetical protein
MQQQLTSSEMLVYNFLSQAYNQFTKLPVIFDKDSGDFAYHINALKNITLARVGLRQLGTAHDTTSKIAWLAENALDEFLLHNQTINDDCVIFSYTTGKTACKFELLSVGNRGYSNCLFFGENGYSSESAEELAPFNGDTWYIKLLSFCRNIDQALESED